ADAHPRGVRRLAPGRQRGGEDLERLEDLDLRLLLHPGPLEEDRERPAVVGAEDDIDPGRLLRDRRPVLLRQAATDRDLHAGPLRLHWCEVYDGAVQAVVRGLA